LLLVILLALVVALLLTLLLWNVKAAAQTKIGSWIGLRLPVYDYACKCYRYFKLNPDQFQIDPDPAGTSDGIWSTKLLAAPGTNPIDALNRTWLPTGLPPVKGESCGDRTGAVWIGKMGVFVCVPNEQTLNFVWARIAIETVP
jgi:hypothetical protein